MAITPFTPISFYCNKTLPEIFDDSLSYYEAITKLMSKINDVGGSFNSFLSELTLKEYSGDITTKRKLSVLGNFTGTLQGVTIPKVFADIADALSFCKTIIAMVNNRESIGTIYDGGLFLEVVPPIITIEGGLF